MKNHVRKIMHGNCNLGNLPKVSLARINIAWLLHRSPRILSIPGTSSLKHFEENVNAASISLTEEDLNFLK
jgi:aryl-alcohol dehydrogenase-like predicted oxidoreductase